MPESDRSVPISASSPDKSFTDLTKPHPWSALAAEHEGWDDLKQTRQTKQTRSTTAAAKAEMSHLWVIDRLQQLGYSISR